MKRFTAVAYLGIATLLLTAQTQSGHACPSPRPQESVLHQIIPSLEVKQGDVRDVIRKLFKTGNVSYTIAPEVQGGVSVSLKNVTFEAALHNVLKQVDATYRVEGGVFSIVRRIGDVASVLNESETARLAPPPSITPPALPVLSKESPSIVQDIKFLYIVRGSSMFKVRKSDMKVVATGKLPG